ncbi:hypothetical protein [Pseudaminobacter sp. NGMCC 1.201702]|uniref:hypothetical protein n=1 Tax=Pseudaminobacter sp. NGMCC 1.201702 TaxID=3391825 RepID=UPI0039EF35C9
MDDFNTVSALIDISGAGTIEEAKALLQRFRVTSEALTTTIDEFPLDLMTLNFLLDADKEGAQKSIRKLARMRLTNIKFLIQNTARSEPLDTP